MKSAAPKSSEMDQYMKDINRYPLLTRAEESTLAKKFAATGDKASRDRIINSNLRFVVKVAHSFRGYGFPLIDLIQEGNLGLVKALEKFQPKRGLRFISYAVWWIRAYMQNYIMRSWSLVKVGTTGDQRMLFYKLKQAQAKLWGQERVNEQLAEMLGVSEEVIVEMDCRMRHKDLSLDAPVGDGDERVLSDFIEDEDDAPDEKVSDKAMKEKLDAQIIKALLTLSPNESRVIMQRFLTEDSQTLNEIGEEMDLSRERVRQIQANAIRKLKKQLAAVAA